MTESDPLDESQHTMAGTLPGTVGVYGGGRMGAGIAHSFLVEGSTVVIVERDQPSADAAAERVAGSLEKAESRGALPGLATDILSRLTTTTSAAALGSSELVIECVSEQLDLKRDVLRVAEAAAPNAVLATNTSSLSIGLLSEVLADPTRLIGLHFFNPVPVSDLIEIVIGPHTDPVLVTRATDWATALGKTGIVVKDVPGFATSRLGVSLALEAIRMLEEGVASAADIDAALTLGYRHQMGPLRTTDIVGLDVRLLIADHLAVELGERFRAPELLRTMVSSGQLGRKTGQGFYVW